MESEGRRSPTLAVGALIVNPDISRAEAAECLTDAIGDGASFPDPSRRRSLGGRPLRNRWYRALRRIVWRRLPNPVRQAAYRVLARSGTPLAIDAPAAMPICLIGLLSAPTGIGEGGRLAGRALIALGYDVLTVDLVDILAVTPPVAAIPPPLEPGAGTAILHFNPLNLAAVLTALGRQRLRGKRIIGYWAWEVARVPDQWIEALEEVDEVWTPSRFVADVIRQVTSKPVRVVLHPVAQGRSGTPRRAHFGLGDQFVALAMFSFVSFDRKNPIAAVRAFRQAFGDADDRLLVLKCLDADKAPKEMAKLHAAIGGASNIRIETELLSDVDRLDLIASADVLLSLHRSEGFGLVMAEAMRARVPVIATAWSGNLDYMDDSSALLVPFHMAPAFGDRGLYDGGHFWAEPDIASAAEHLSALAADPSRFEPIRNIAQAKAEKILGLEGFSQAVRGGVLPDRRRQRGSADDRRFALPKTNQPGSLASEESQTQS